MTWRIPTREELGATVPYISQMGFLSNNRADKLIIRVVCSVEEAFPILLRLGGDISTTTTGPRQGMEAWTMAGGQAYTVLKVWLPYIERTDSYRYGFAKAAIARWEAELAKNSNLVD